MNVPDNYDRWEQHDAEQQAELNKLPKCERCEEPIQDYYCFEIDNALYCDKCMKDLYRVKTDEFID